VSFPLLSAGYLLLCVSQIFPFHINQLRLEKRAKSKALALCPAHNCPLTTQRNAKMDHKTGAYTTSAHPRMQGRFGRHLPPALKPSAVTLRVG